MKLLILAQSAGVGGVETSLSNVVRYLVSQGHDVTLVFWRDSGPVLASLPNGVRIIDVQTGFARDLYRTSGLKEVLRSADPGDRVKGIGLIALRGLLRLYRNPWILLNRIPERFDVAIAFRHQGYGPYFLVDRVSARKKVMWYHHGEYEPSPMGFKVDRAYFERMDAVVAVSETAKSLILDRFPALEGRVRVIHNIIDEDEIRRRSLAPLENVPTAPGLTLVTVSRLSREKGVDIAVETAKVLQGRGIDFTWHVIGDGPERARLEGLVARLGVGDRFLLLGEKTNPFPFMRRADMYVQTSRVEAHPLTIQEAMVLGKPILASSIPSIAAVLEQGRLGALSELEPEAFADGIQALASDPARRGLFSARLAQHTAPNEAVHRGIDGLLAE